ncbi:unnamed protein product [Triticum turgidum subsp. durum]|uniref:WRKY19-like zinc finger domain-containing protein n=1 Tax=Triticum turgidum subsp. durum TaxID=4567 RepID=A0A9R0RKU8_TRITD|nr:unnamed protein product [Triticum turgidum subsp. durum]
MDKTSHGLGFGDRINSVNTSHYQSSVEHTAQHRDTLDSTSYSSFSFTNTKALKRKWGTMAGAEGTGDALLTLGLGRSPSSSDNSKVSSATACAMSPCSLKEADEESSVDLSLNFELSLGNDVAHFQRKSSAALVAKSPKLDLQLSLSTGSPESAVTCTNMVSPNIHDGLDIPVTYSLPAIIGNGSAPSSWGFEHSVVSSSYASEATYAFPFSKIPRQENGALASPVISSTMPASVKSSVASTSVVTNPQQRNLNTKTCQFPGCGKGARGASGHCIAHGGGRRCQKPGCQKGAEGRTIYCKAHGGVCPKSVHGGTQYCVAHGGGKRCAISDCTKSARGRTEYCVRHGGGKRCRFDGCVKSAQGSTDFCKAHGGGKRCSWGLPDSSFGIGTEQCDKFARSKTGLCSAHTALVQDHCVHGGGTLGPVIHHFATDVKPDEMEIAAAVKVDPVSMQSEPPLPEGRVHGGGLLALLSRGGNHTGPVGNSENGASVMMAWM